MSLKPPQSGDLPVHRIRAAVLRRGGTPLRIETLELEGPRPDEVLVRLTASGICHTDIDFCDDWDGPPVVLDCPVSGRAVSLRPSREVL